jgi:flagellar protein FliO/FliZ
MLCASTAVAAGDSERTPLRLDEPGSQVAASGGGGGSIVRTIVGLAIVIGVIYGVYWILKQVKASREEQASGQGLSSVATLPLGPNRSLHLVRSGQELVLLGVGEQGVTPIRHYSEDEAVEAGLIDDEPVPVALLEPGQPANASDFFNRLLNDLRARTVRR